MNRGNARKLTAYFVAFLAGDVATQIQTVALAWHIFTLHHRPFDLGLVGLTLFVPTAALVFVTGMFADRHDRKAIVIGSTVVEIIATMGFIALAGAHTNRLFPYLSAILALGVARAFSAPAERGMLLALVPEHSYLRVSSAYSSIRKLVSIGGPAAGGALVVFGVPVALGVSAVFLALSAGALTALPLPARTAARASGTPTLDEALGGLHFIRSAPIIMAAISLDLFAVLFGGATALLPAYADTILRVGPAGLGLLRSAPALGAFAIAVYLARRPPERRVGRTLLIAVAVFGAATIVFGISRDFALSIAALAVLGGADMVSVVIRTGLVQLATPDAMRGRVNAVENVFIGASNELGDFESGTVAAAIGVVPAVVSGGIATLLVVIWSLAAFPQLRRLDRFARAAHSS